MSLRIDIGWLIATLLLSVRVASATLFAPVLGPSQIPASARVIFVMGLSAFLVATMPPVALESMTPAALFAATLAEAVLGLAFASGFIAAYAATQVAGRVLDIQVGFGAAAILNPATTAMSSLLGSVLGMLFVAVFLAVDGHLLLIKALAASMEAHPPGSLPVNLDAAPLLAHSAVTFTFGLTLAAPVMFMLLLADLALAVLARSMPQLNVFVLGFAIKIILGLSGLAIAIRVGETVLSRLLDANFAYWDRLATGA